MNYVAFRCSKCGTINVLSALPADGHICKHCQGPLIPIGNAIVEEKEDNSLRTLSIPIKLEGVETFKDNLNDLENLLDRIIKKKNSIIS